MRRINEENKRKTTEIYFLKLILTLCVYMLLFPKNKGNKHALFFVANAPCMCFGIGMGESNLTYSIAFINYDFIFGCTELLILEIYLI